MEEYIIDVTENKLLGCGPSDCCTPYWSCEPCCYPEEQCDPGIVQCSPDMEDCYPNT